MSAKWPDDLAIPADLIERHVRLLLRSGYRPTDAGGVLTGSHGKFHVTFDDAYRNVEAVLPGLARMGVPATVFACTQLAEDGDSFAVPEVQERTRGYETEVATMDWQALRRLNEFGVEVGSHTVSHPHLTELDDLELCRQLQESKARIEDELGGNCRYLAYPYGEHDDRVAAAARDAGYEAAFALHSRSRSLWAFPRVDLYRKDSMIRVALKVSPMRSTLLAIRDRARR